MTIKIASLLCLTLTLPAFALSPGDEVTVDSIGTADFVQSSAPNSWEPGKVYIIECWATWCGPCVAAIPHIDGLYDKYHEKGLIVFGMNVWEDGKDKVADFVKKKGDGMSYPVAYVGKGGEFETTWLKAAGVRGIPHAFVVKDGKLLFGIHPASLSEKTVEALLEGGDAEKVLIESARKASAAEDAIITQRLAFSAARKAGDGEAMTAAIAELEKLSPKNSALAQMKMDLAVVNKNWDEATELLKATDADKAVMNAVFISRKTDASADEPSVALLETMARALSGAKVKDLWTGIHLARVQWKLGRKDEAVATAKELVARYKDNKKWKESLDAFADSLETENPQTYDELLKAIR